MNSYAPKILTFQVEEDRGSLGDDTALNGMTIFCEPQGFHAEEEFTYGVMESFYGTWGYWREIFYCPDNMYMVQFMVGRSLNNR